MDQQTRERQAMQAVVNAAAKDPYFWALAFRKMPDGSPYALLNYRNQDGSMRYTDYTPGCDYRYLRGVYEEVSNLKRSGRICVMKCAQTGWTELAVNTTLWFMDKKHEGALYMLPSSDQLGQFAQARIDAAIRNSPVLAAAFPDTSNVGLKVGFGVPLYLRGARSLEKLREIPVGLLVRDEYGEMTEEGREQALSRLGASNYKYVIDLGNPKYPESGIHELYMKGTQQAWKIPCKKCGEELEPRWPDSLKEIEVRGNPKWSLVCANCGSPIIATSGRWVAANVAGLYASYRMSQLVSPKVRPEEIMRAWNIAKGNSTAEQNFFNFVIGIPYAPAGSGIDDTILSKLPKLGVDVGAVLHVVIRREEGGIIWAGVCDWEELARKIPMYNVQHCVIDSMPEISKAKDFAKAFRGRVTLCRYLHPKKRGGRRDSFEDGVSFVEISRTEAIDMAFQRFFNGEEAVAENLPGMFYKHIKNMTRVILSQGGSEFATWQETGDDHFGHSFVYSELARPMSGSDEQNQIFL
jgi:hypothetical protein